MAKTNKKNNNKLDFNTIKKASENNFTTKTIIIPVNNQDYEVTLDMVFRTTKIERLIKTLVNSDNIKKFSEYDESIKLGYYFYLIIREFTDLDIPDGLSIEEEINLINSLIDLGIFEAIMSEIPESEITKVNDYLQKFNMNLNKFTEEMNEGKDIDDVENIEEFTFNENVIVNDDEGGQSE